MLCGINVETPLMKKNRYNNGEKNAESSVASGEITIDDQDIEI